MSARNGICCGMALLMSGCALALAEVRYTGTLTPEGPCGSVSHSTMTEIGTRIAFTPSDGVLVLRGSLSPDGTINAQLATAGAGGRSDALSPPAGKPGTTSAKPESAGKQPFVLTFAAKIVGEMVTGTYSTPRCTFNVALMKVHPPLL